MRAAVPIMSKSRSAMTKAYREHQDVIQKTVDHFMTQYHQRGGMRRDDYLADANSDFIDAFHKWVPERATFRQYLRYYLHKQMLERLRVRMMRNNRLTRVVDYDLNTAKEREEGRFRLGDFLSELSDDAKSVVGMIFDTPMDVRMALLQRCNEKDVDVARPGAVRMALREYLQDLGWSMKTISSTFSEIRTAL